MLTTVIFGAWWVVLFLTFSPGGQAQSLAPTSFSLPVRVIAVADVEGLQHGKYSIREFLDVYNDDFSRPLEVKAVSADSWVGRRHDQESENWLDEPGPVLIPPATMVRIAERQRIVAGVPRRNWWVRWLRFTIQTDRGEFVSNFVASPLKPPGVVEKIIKPPEVDPLTAPGLRSPVSSETQ